MSLRTDTQPMPLPPAAAQAVRMFGHYQLLNLVGKSARTMLWQVADVRHGQEMLLAVPRAQPPDARAMQRWTARAQRAARLDHPRLAPAVEVGEYDRWPYVAYDRRQCSTLSELLSRKGMPPADVGRWSLGLLEGLAFAHEAGVAHHDIQAFMVLVNEQGLPSFLGLEVASPSQSASPGAEAAAERQIHREHADRDLLSFGLLMHHALAGQPALGEADIGRVIDRLPPSGRDFVRLPWDLPHPVPDPLRAIVNRATDRQQRHRYHAARTLQHALEGWLQAYTAQGGGPLSQLLERIITVGVLPATPGANDRAARLALMEQRRTDDLAEVMLGDFALCVEMLRTVNGPRLKSLQLAGSGAVLTVRRAIAMIGMDGVRRCALSLRDWPGPMNAVAAERLAVAFAQTRRAAQLAQALRPAGYDAEVVFLVTVLQNLGALTLHYHFPEEALQIERLMQAEPSSTPGGPEEPGLDHQAAAFAVLGIDMDELGVAVVRHLGFTDELQALLRRMPPHLPVRSDHSDVEVLRGLASCAHELAHALARPAARPVMQYQKILQRYGRLLGLTLDDIVAAVRGEVRSQPPAQTVAT